MHGMLKDATECYRMMQDNVKRYTDKSIILPFTHLDLCLLFTHFFNRDIFFLFLIKDCFSVAF